MFALFYVIAIYISGSLKYYERNYTVQQERVVNEYHSPLALMKSFTVNNNYILLIKIFFINRIICILLIELVNI